MEISRAHNNLINQFGSMQFSGEARIMLITRVSAQHYAIQKAFLSLWRRLEIDQVPLTFP